MYNIALYVFLDVFLSWKTIFGIKSKIEQSLHSITFVLRQRRTLECADSVNWRWSSSKKAQIFNVIGWMLITYVNNVNHDNALIMNLTKSAKFEPLLIRSSYSVFVLSFLLWLNKSNYQANKSIPARQPILNNRYQWIDFILSKRCFSSENVLLHNNPS